MAEPIDSLESELASFRPQPVSLELRARIGAELTSHQPRHWTRILIGSVAGLAAAACVVVGVAMWAQQSTTSITKNAGDAGTRPAGNNIVPTVGASAGFTASPPTLMDYRRAFDESSDALDALLARPAGRETGVERRSGAWEVTAFERSTNHLTTNGDSL
jgi:hypothetical protein